MNIYPPQCEHIDGLISDSVNTFQTSEYKAMAVLIIHLAPVISFITQSVPSSIAFIVGAITLILAGWIGMKTEVYTNTHTAHECWAPTDGVTRGSCTAIQGGCVLGFSLVSLGILNLFVFNGCVMLSGAFECITFGNPPQYDDAITLVQQPTCFTDLASSGSRPNHC